MRENKQREWRERYAGDFKRNCCARKEDHRVDAGAIGNLEDRENEMSEN